MNAAMRCPVCRRRDSHSGFRTERENLAGDAKGKDTSSYNREVESTDAPERAGLPWISDEAGQCPWSEGGRSSPGTNPISSMEGGGAMARAV